MTATLRLVESQDPASAPFFSLMDKAAAEKGHDQRDMALSTCVTFGYVQQLRLGIRSLDAISMEFARACAGYAGTTLDELFGSSVGTKH